MVAVKGGGKALIGAKKKRPKALENFISSVLAGSRSDCFAGTNALGADFDGAYGAVDDTLFLLDIGLEDALVGLDQLQTDTALLLGNTTVYDGTADNRLLVTEKTLIGHGLNSFIS